MILIASYCLIGMATLLAVVATGYRPPITWSEPAVAAVQIALLIVVWPLFYLAVAYRLAELLARRWHR